MQKLKKIFSKKNNLIVSIVALVECIILLSVATFSWIESKSSLVIKGNNLPISQNVNYRFDVKDDAGSSMVDLSTYFRPTALYQMAHASSPDGQNFYFKKADSTTYRLGDTTDYNTSYYNFDFQVHNETAKTFNYYFDKAEIFTVTSDKELDADTKRAAEGAFRIAVTAGTNAQNTRVYSRDSVTYSAVNTLAGGTKSVTSTGLSGESEYNYQTNTNNNIFVFSTTGGGDDTKVNIKIWFEEKDIAYQALSDENKKKLEGATVSINLKFVNSESNFQTFFFEDYTFSTEEGHEGMHVTSEDQTKSLYFYYNDGTTGSVIPMTTTTSQNESIRWVTASDSGEPTPRISDAMRNALIADPSKGYFFYGTYNESTGVKTEHYKWPITKPAVNSGNIYIFKALSVLTYNSNSTGYGVWDNVPIKLWHFKDQTTCATSDLYSPNAFQFINEQGQKRLYLSDSTTASANTTCMYYDSTDDIWKGYYAYSENFTPIFSYTSSSNYANANIKVQWTASNPAEYNGKTIYRALGYEGAGTANSQSKATGVGTWMETEQITLSTELVDNLMNSKYRYKIAVDIGDSYKYYYMAVDNNSTQFKAFVPVGTGGTTDNAIMFQRLATYSTATVSGTWNSGATIRDNSSIFYATDMAADSSSGQWHIGVVVDGSADNIINNILNTVEDAKLEYSVDGGASYIEMNKLDNYRWFTDDFSGDITTINYRWTAYTGPGVNEAVFTYGHDLVDGIYFNITE